jgi:uncharacterized protein YfaA (DUF2138 family)
MAKVLSPTFHVAVDDDDTSEPTVTEIAGMDGMLLIHIPLDGCSNLIFTGSEDALLALLGRVRDAILDGPAEARGLDGEHDGPRDA